MSSKSHRREQKRAKILLKEVRKLQKRYASNLAEQHQKSLQDAIQALDNAMRGGGDIAEVALKLEQIAGKLFAPYRKSTFREYAESIAIAIAIALLLRTFVIEPFKIPSGSMIPTLEIGDHIFVSKFSYGLWLPFTQKKIRLGSGPKRGDVIVFVYPKNPDKDFIKRVVGLPGDSIKVVSNTVYLNNKPLTAKRGKKYTYREREQPDSLPIEQVCRVYYENLKGVKHRILIDESQPSKLSNWNSSVEAKQIERSWGPKVPPGYVFVMGDNRDHSSDSREWGLVPVKNIKGKAFLVWLSFGGGQGFRWDRVFVPIQ